VTLPDGTVFDTSYTTVADALGGISAGGTIWIDDGEYVFTSGIYFNKENQYDITLRGVHGAEKTILSYAEKGTDYFFYPNLPNNPPSFVGLTFRRGHWTGMQASGGSCVYCDFKDIRDCVFEDCSAPTTAWMGAACLYATRSDCMISNCVFRNNGLLADGSVGGGSGALITGANTKIIDCVFEGNHSVNKSTGTGVFSVGENSLVSHCQFITNFVGYGSYAKANTRIEKCTFVSNTNTLEGVYTYGACLMAAGSGVTVADSYFTNNVAGCLTCLGTVNDNAYDLFVSNCVFVANVATGHKAASVSAGNGRAEVYDSWFIGNRAENNASAAIHAAGSGSILRNLLIANNYGTLEPAAVNIGSGAFLENLTVVGNRLNKNSGIAGIMGPNNTVVTFYNVVFADNKNNSGNGHTYVGGSLSHYYNCHFDAGATTYKAADSAITTGDPKFVDAANGDYRVTSKSPLRNKGENRDWMAKAKDLTGRRDRILEGTVDIGCYEYVPGGLMMLVK